MEAKVNSKTEKYYDVEAVQNWLKSYGEKKDDIEFQQLRIEKIDMQLINPGSPTLSDTPKYHSDVQDRMAELSSYKMDLEKEVAQCQKDAKQLRNEIEDVLSHLKKASEKAVIRLRYIDRDEWDDIVFDIFGKKEDFIDKEESYKRRTFRIHGAALLNMAIYIEDGNI